MKNLISTSVIALIGRCARELSSLHQNLHVPEPLKPETPPDLNREDYLISNYFAANYLNCSLTTLKLFKRLGVIKFFNYNRNSWFLKADLDNAKATNARLAHLCKIARISTLLNDTVAPKLVYSSAMVSDSWFFIQMTYQRWSSTIVCPVSCYNVPGYVKAICKQVIILQHSVKPFPVVPE